MEGRRETPPPGVRRGVLPAGAASGVTLTAAALVMGALAVMGRAITSCSSVVRGGPGDATSGAVWLNWAWSRTGGGPFTAVQVLTGAGRGDVLWRPLAVVNALWALPMWAMSELTGPVCGYNLTILLGFVSSGLGMWVLVWWATRRRLVALVAALVFAFSAFTQVKSEAHPSGVFLGLFPLLIWAVLRVWEQPTLGRATVMAVVGAGLPYTDGYYIAFAPALVMATVCGLVATDVRRGSAVVGELRRRGVMLIVAAVGTGVLLVPFALATMGSRSAVAQEPSRSDRAAEVYSARLYEYVVPPFDQPLLGRWLAPWKFDHLHGSNTVETSLYLGWVPIGLAGFGLLALRRRSRRALDDGGGTDRATEPIARRSTSIALLVVGATGLVLSLGPTVAVFGVDVPMPARIVRTVFPQIRVYARASVMVSTAVVALAALGLDRVLRRTGDRRRRFALAGMVLVAALFESATAWPFGAPMWSYADDTPAVYRDLADDVTVDTVARYPMSDPSDETGHQVFTFQPALDEVLVNPVLDTPEPDDPADLARGIAALDGASTVPVLRALGTDVVVVERDSMGRRPDDAALAELGLEYERSYHWSGDDVRQPGAVYANGFMSTFVNVDVFRVADGPTADVAVALGAGWYDWQTTGWGGSRAMSGTAQVTVVDLRVGAQAPGDGTTEVAAEVTLETMPGDRDVAVGVFDGDRRVASVTVPAAGGSVTFRAIVGRTLELRADTAPAETTIAGAAGTRGVSLTIVDVSAVLAPAPAP